MTGGVAVSALYAGLFGLFAVLLANNVLYARVRAAVLPKWKPDAHLRVQANFVENVPLALVLLLALELQHTPPLALHVLGGAFGCCTLGGLRSMRAPTTHASSVHKARFC